MMGFRQVEDESRQRLVLVDYQSYIDCQRHMDATYLDKKKWTAMTIVNVARMGSFLRTVQSGLRLTRNHQETPFRTLSHGTILPQCREKMARIRTKGEHCWSVEWVLRADRFEHFPGDRNQDYPFIPRDMPSESLPSGGGSCPYPNTRGGLRNVPE